QHHEIGAVDRRLGVGGGPDGRRQQQVGVVLLVAPGGLDLLGDLGAPGPERDLGAGVGENLRERGTPRAGGEHRRPADGDHGTSRVAGAAGSTTPTPSAPGPLASAAPSGPAASGPASSGAAPFAPTPRRPAELGAGGGSSPRISPTIRRSTDM